MRKVARLAYAAFETPEIDRQVDYYQRIMGLTLVERAADTAHLSATIDHHTVVLASGPTPRCARLGMQLSEHTDLDDMERTLATMGVESKRARDVQPGIPQQ